MNLVLEMCFLFLPLLNVSVRVLSDLCYVIVNLQ